MQAKGIVKDAVNSVPDPSEAVDKVSNTCLRTHTRQACHLRLGICVAKCAHVDVRNGAHVDVTNARCRLCHCKIWHLLTAAYDSNKRL
jgi:hypothetical protein